MFIGGRCHATMVDRVFDISTAVSVPLGKKLAAWKFTPSEGHFERCNGCFGTTASAGYASTGGSSLFCNLMNYLRHGHAQKSHLVECRLHWAGMTLEGAAHKDTGLQHYTGTLVAHPSR